MSMVNLSLGGTSPFCLRIIRPRRFTSTITGGVPQERKNPGSRPGSHRSSKRQRRVRRPVQLTLDRALLFFGRHGPRGANDNKARSTCRLAASPTVGPSVGPPNRFTTDCGTRTANIVRIPEVSLKPDDCRCLSVCRRGVRRIKRKGLNPPNSPASPFSLAQLVRRVLLGGRRLPPPAHRAPSRPRRRCAER